MKDLINDSKKQYNTRVCAASGLPGTTAFSAISAEFPVTSSLPRQTVKNAIEEAAALTPPGTKRQLAFYGGSFTAIPEARQIELFEAAQPYLADGTISSIRLSTRPDAIDGTVLKRLKKYGVTVIELGAQSMCDRVLELSYRGHDSAAVADSSRLIKAAGFDLILQMMTGLPGDTDESCIETAKKIIDLAPNGVRIYPTVIVRDTVPLRHVACRNVEGAHGRGRCARVLKDRAAV